jgi:type IV pilus assembly protein PilO
MPSMTPTRPTSRPSSHLTMCLHDFRARMIVACGHWRLHHPIAGNWIPCVISACLSMIAGAVIIWQFPCKTANADLERLQRQADVLGKTYAQQLMQMPEIDHLYSVRRRAAQRLALQRQQLTAAGEQETIMEEIDSAGRARGLQFTAFKPEHGKPALAVQLTAVGTYRTVTRFAGDLARLPRILTLDALILQTAPAKDEVPDGMLTLQVTATAAAAGPDLLNTDAIGTKEHAASMSAAERETRERDEGNDGEESERGNEGDGGYKAERDESSERDENAD